MCVERPLIHAMYVIKRTEHHQSYSAMYAYILVNDHMLAIYAGVDSHVPITLSSI